VCKCRWVKESGTAGGSVALVFEWVRNSANYTDVMPGDRSVTPPILLRGSLSPPGAGPSLS
jgi:hypothetical protein